MNKLQNFSKGLIKENPVLVLVLGTCPTLATSTSIINALGMGWSSPPCAKSYPTRCAFPATSC